VRGAAGGHANRAGGEAGSEALDAVVRSGVAGKRNGEGLAERSGASPAVAWAYGRILETGGTMPIGLIAARLGWSRKHLVSRFREEVGLGPKTVARIARFGRAQAMAARGGETGWADIAAACGYADQAHLIREFTALAGSTPSAWRAGA
jgi:AraC-like DNA-binding protein